MKHPIQYFLLTLTGFLLSTASFTQSYCCKELTDKTVLSGLVRESSALALHNGIIYTHNDSGGEAEIYSFNADQPEKISTHKIDGTKNIDWEDICIGNNTLYIGEFGNNNGNRKDLCVYPVDIRETQWKTLEPIYFRYSDQKDFDEQKLQHNFDCEAMCFVAGNLWLFTKNWEDGKSRVYTLPAKSGKYVPEPILELDIDGLITGADYQDGTLALIGYKDWESFVWIFEGIEKAEDLKIEKGTRIDLNCMAGSQTEGIAFKDKQSLFISTEATPLYEPAMYTLRLDTPEEACTSARLDKNKNQITIHFPYWEGKTDIELLNKKSKPTEVFHNVPIENKEAVIHPKNQIKGRHFIRIKHPEGGCTIKIKES